ncbi:hypothetical protein [Streptacidiphilus fuscans]|uniref:Uncharacterized protein n=1 Tax=Streptacidiphilus fuscans TaxID=2789292 RepID=A0A931B9S8_9ACTN|nr:hypothetical protein [Streptacidiphilus fuscans]MBF9070373.1 hypothetical protein [Streptacidiphilus fuscans]
MSINPPPGGYPEQQPGYGQPGFQQDPGYPQQGYPQAGYQEPGFQQPGYQQPGYQQPMDPNAAWAYGAPVPPPKKRSLLKIVLICAGAFIVVIGGAIGWFVYSQASQMGKYKLTPPASFDGASLTTNNSVGNSLTSANAKIAQAGQTPVTAIYGPDTGMPKYVSYGLYGGLPLPSVQLDAAFKGATSGGATITQQTNEDAGPQGGDMRCGVMNVPNSGTSVSIPICAWADNSTMDILMQIPDASGQTTIDLPTLAEKTRELRQQMEVAK